MKSFLIEHKVKVAAGSAAVIVGCLFLLFYSLHSEIKRVEGEMYKNRQVIELLGNFINQATNGALEKAIQK